MIRIFLKWIPQLIQASVDKVKLNKREIHSKCSDQNTWTTSKLILQKSKKIDSQLTLPMRKEIDPYISLKNKRRCSKKMSNLANQNCFRVAKETLMTILISILSRIYKKPKDEKSYQGKTMIELELKNCKLEF